jgi:hypothetical protein
MSKASVFGMIAVGLVTGLFWAASRCAPQEETGAGERGTTPPASIFVRPVKAELQEEIGGLEASISKQHPLSKEEAEELGRRVLAYDDRYATSGAAAEFVRDLRNLGLAIVPVISRLCVDADAGVRAKARFVLASLLLPHELWYDDYPEVERVVLPYFLRFALDVDPAVREGALMSMARLVRDRWPDPDPRAMTALVVSAVTDQEETVRLPVLRELKLLGLPVEHPKVPKRIFR